MFEPGDAWFRTGDLMRRDDSGFYYFVDRIGDTFRWKGENVATSEVAAAITAFPGIVDANVYGVAIPGADGRAGMAEIVCAGTIDLAALREHLARSPAEIRPSGAAAHAQRDRHHADLQAAQARRCAGRLRSGACPDALYVHDPDRRAYVVLDQALYERIRSGKMRL